MNNTSSPTLSTFINSLTGILQTILAFMIALAIVIFVWYVIKYFIVAGDNAASKKEAGMYVMYSLIGFFVIFSLWGLIGILMNTFGLGNNTNQPSSWANISNIFPGGTGSTGSSISNQNTGSSISNQQTQFNQTQFNNSVNAAQ